MTLALSFLPLHNCTISGHNLELAVDCQNLEKKKSVNDLLTTRKVVLRKLRLNHLLRIKDHATSVEEDILQKQIVQQRTKIVLTAVKLDILQQCAINPTKIMAFHLEVSNMDLKF